MTQIFSFKSHFTSVRANTYWFFSRLCDQNIIIRIKANCTTLFCNVSYTVRYCPFLPIRQQCEPPQLESSVVMIGVRITAEWSDEYRYGYVNYYNQNCSGQLYLLNVECWMKIENALSKLFVWCHIFSCPNVLSEQF